MTPEQTAAILRLYAREYSVAVIAAQLKISEADVRYVINSALNRL